MFTTTKQCCIIWSGLLTTLLCSGIVYSTIEFSPYISKLPHTITHVNLFISNGYNTLDNVEHFVHSGYDTLDVVNTFIGNISQLQGEITNITELAHPILENTRRLIDNGEITIEKINTISRVANKTLHDIQELIKLMEFIINTTYIPTSADVISDIYNEPKTIIPSQPPQQQNNDVPKSIPDPIYQTIPDIIPNR